MSPDECAALAGRAAALVNVAALPADVSQLLWEDEDSVAWLEVSSQWRDTGFHDHDGSAVGVYVITGDVSNEGLPVGGPRRARQYQAGESFSFPGSGIHRMAHGAGAITVHVYSPPLRAIGYYELVNGLLQRVSGPPDQPSPESPRLLAAVGRDEAVSQPARDAFAPVGAELPAGPGSRDGAAARPLVH